MARKNKKVSLSTEDRRLVLESLNIARGIQEHRFIVNTLDREHRDAKVVHLARVMNRFYD